MPLSLTFMSMSFWLMLVGKGVNVRMLNIHLSVLSILLLPNMRCIYIICIHKLMQFVRMLRKALSR